MGIKSCIFFMLKKFAGIKFGVFGKILLKEDFFWRDFYRGLNLAKMTYPRKPRIKSPANISALTVHYYKQKIYCYSYKLMLSWYLCKLLFSLFSPPHKQSDLKEAKRRNTKKYRASMGLAEEGNNNAATTTAVLQQQQLNENQQQRREGAAAKRKRRRDSSADYSSDHNISIPTLEDDVKKVRSGHLLLLFFVELQKWVWQPCLSVSLSRTH